MIKILILGATGMLGHKLMQVLSDNFSVIGTVRHSETRYKSHPVFKKMHLIGQVHADDLKSVENTIQMVRPDVAINCIGIVKQLPEALDPVPSIAINALFPHQLARLCQEKSISLIHMSTDCVFFGRKGNYTEDEASDADDLYGRTKYLGEVTYDNCLTLRTSIVGRELENPHSLVEWFLAQGGKKVQGYKNAIFSGLTTNALADVIAQIIQKYASLQGLYHVASNPISKFDLLTIIKDVYELDIVIELDETVRINRSLNGNRFDEKTNIKIPSWRDMIWQMHQDPTPYKEIRRDHAHQ